MIDNTRMINTKNDLITLIAAAGVVAVEEFVKHPIGGVTAVLGLLYMYDRWRTQHTTKKREQLKLEEDERSIRASKEHKEGPEV